MPKQSQSINPNFDWFKEQARVKALKTHPTWEDRGFHKCECCGFQNQKYGQFWQNNIVMHHVNYNEPQNIVWLCKSCHSLFHHLLRRKPNSSINDLKEWRNSRPDYQRRDSPPWMEKE